MFAQEQSVFLQIKRVDSLKQENVGQLKSTKEFQNTKEIDEYVQKIIENYRLEGYLFCKIVSINKTKPNQFVYYLDFGDYYKGIILSNIHKNEFNEINTLNLKTKNEGELVFSFQEFRRFTQETLKELNKQGKPFDTFQLINIEESQQGYLKAELKFYSNRKRKVDDIVIKGYTEFPKPFLKHKLNIRKGRILNLNEISNQTENFENIAFASSIKEPEIQFTQDSTKVYLYIEKNNANTFDGFIGFNSTEETSLELNGYLNLVLINNLNLGESLSINYKNDGREQQQFNANLQLPYLFKTPLSLSAGLRIFRKDSTFSNSVQNIGLDYQVFPLFNVGVISEFTQSNISLNEVTNANVGEDFQSNFYGIKANYSKSKKITGDFYSTRSFTLNTSMGNRKTSSSTNQLKIELNTIYDLKLKQNLYLNSSITGAWLDSENYLDNELYRFGGLNSIRGFQENSIVASTFASINTEARYFLSSNLYVNSVLDFGYFENEITRIGENLYGFGFGLGLETQAGILRLIFANGTSNSQNFTFENTQVHLTLNTFF
jgi:hypothetical protein